MSWLDRQNITYSRLIGESITNKEVIYSHLYILAVFIFLAIADLICRI